LSIGINIPKDGEMICRSQMHHQYSTPFLQPADYTAMNEMSDFFYLVFKTLAKNTYRSLFSQSGVFCVFFLFSSEGPSSDSI
jgi:hypothetical protein